MLGTVVKPPCLLGLAAPGSSVSERVRAVLRAGRIVVDPGYAKAACG